MISVCALNLSLSLIGKRYIRMMFRLTDINRLLLRSFMRRTLIYKNGSSLCVMALPFLLRRTGAPAHPTCLTSFASADTNLSTFIRAFKLGKLRRTKELWRTGTSGAFIRRSFNVGGTYSKGHFSN
jgi:hypothetical protein